MPRWPPLLSSMPPGTTAWTAATLGGCPTAASDIRSATRDQTAVGEELASTPSTSTRARPASPVLTPDMTPTASEVRESQKCARGHLN